MTSSKKINCWEFKKCGREPHGSRVVELGVCPASTEWRLNLAHGGENAGRVCWVVAGTMCEGSVQGSFALKIQTCIQCDFYQLVHTEENDKFTSPENLKKKLRS